MVPRLPSEPVSGTHPEGRIGPGRSGFRVPRGWDHACPGSGSGDLELHVDVAARGMRIGADLLVRLARQRGQVGLRQAAILDPHLHRQAESAQLARTDRNGTGDSRLARVLFLLFRDEVERTAKTGVAAAGRPGPPISLGSESSALTTPSLVSVCPLRPPIAVAVAV